MDKGRDASGREAVPRTLAPSWRCGSEQGTGRALGRRPERSSLAGECRRSSDRAHVASGERVAPTWTSELRPAPRTRDTPLVTTEDNDSPAAVITALAEATNAHDIDAFVALFAEDYDSQQPAHPDRAFRGREQVRANWSDVFAGVPDF